MWTWRPGCLGVPLPAIFPGRAEQTVARCRAERLVLAIQDTTTLNYDGLSGTSGLDDLGGGGKGTSGILAHVGVAVNGAGRPLGAFRQADVYWLHPSRFPVRARL